MSAEKAANSALDDVLVVTTRKGFWARPESARFRRRVETPLVVGHGTSLVNTTLLGLRLVAAIARRRPRVILVGFAHRIVPALLVLRRLRVLRCGLVVTNQVNFGPRYGRYADRVLVYSRAETQGRENYVFVPIAADGGADRVASAEIPAPYVFAGGATKRDFATLVAAVAGTGIRLVLVTDGPHTLGVDGPMPPEVDVRWRMPLDSFLSLLAGATVVAVPLQGDEDPHGHTTVAQALRVGRAVITTRSPAVADYVSDGVEGLLVEPGDVEGWRSALRRVLDDEPLRQRLEAGARARGAELSFARYAERLEVVVLEVLAERGYPGAGSPAATAASSGR